jgi:hypothetical protein
LSKSKVNMDIGLMMAIIDQRGERAVKGVSEIMLAESEKIAQMAQEFAPVDEHDLERAIMVEKDRTGTNRRLMTAVFVDESAVTEKGDALVGEYALMMEEGLAPYGSGAFNLGEKSKEKARGGYKVGGKFMARAFEEGKKRLMKRVRDFVKRKR